MCVCESFVLKLQRSLLLRLLFPFPGVVYPMHSTFSGMTLVRVVMCRLTMDASTWLDPFLQHAMALDCVQAAGDRALLFTYVM